jgi:hypothetical protein
MGKGEDEFWKNGIAPRKKKQFLLHRADLLRGKLDEGRTYEQLADHIKKEYGIEMSVDWLKKVMRASTKAAKTSLTNAALPHSPSGTSTAAAPSPALPTPSPTSAPPPVADPAKAAESPGGGWVEPDKDSKDHSRRGRR